jgi:hypothetical protein
MSFTIAEQRIVDAAADNPPATVRGAQRFAAAVEKLDKTATPIDLTTATSSDVGKMLDAAVAADLGAESRARHLATLRAIAAERIEQAWSEAKPELEARFRAAFDTAATELVEELGRLGDGFGPASVRNPHDQRYARLRDILMRLDAGQTLRHCFPVEPLTNRQERDLSTVCVLKRGAASAIEFVNRREHQGSTGPEFWLDLARSPEVDRIAWQSSADQQRQPGPAAQRERERKLAADFAEQEAARRMVSA